MRVSQARFFSANAYVADQGKLVILKEAKSSCDFYGLIANFFDCSQSLPPGAENLVLRSEVEIDPTPHGLQLFRANG